MHPNILKPFLRFQREKNFLRGKKVPQRIKRFSERKRFLQEKKIQWAKSYSHGKKLSNRKKTLSWRNVSQRKK